MRKRRVFGVLAAMPLLTGGVVVGSTTGASALSNNASCAAQFVHGAPGPPGQFQSQAHLPRFGQLVSEVARTPTDACFSCVCPTDETAGVSAAIEP